MMNPSVWSAENVKASDTIVFELPQELRAFICKNISISDYMPSIQHGCNEIRSTRNTTGFGGYRDLEQ